MFAFFSDETCTLYTHNVINEKERIEVISLKYNLSATRTPIKCFKEKLSTSSFPINLVKSSEKRNKKTCFASVRSKVCQYVLRTMHGCWIFFLYICSALHAEVNKLWRIWGYCLLGSLVRSLVHSFKMLNWEMGFSLIYCLDLFFGNLLLEKNFIYILNSHANTNIK